MTTLVAADDHWTLLALMTAGTAASLWLESRYRWADKISAPVLALLIAMVLSNTGVVPNDAPSYDFIGTWLVPLALPLLLQQANVIRIARETGKLFLAVHLSTIGTVIGAFGAVALMRNGGGVPEIEKAAAIMTASYVGGMVNFLAVQDTVKADQSMTSALIVADNLVMAGFFLVLLWMAGSRFFMKHFSHPHILAAQGEVATKEEEETPLTVIKLGAAIAFAFGVVAIAMALGKFNRGLFPETITPGSWLHFTQALATNRFVVITLVSLVVATFCHRWLAPLRGTERIGAYMLYLFLFSIGLPADLRMVLTQSAGMFGFCTIMAVGNLGFTLLLGKLLRLELEPLLISVNATLGGPPTAAAMAVSRGWSKLVLPGLLAGLWGYAIGTPVGLMVYAGLTHR